MTASFSSFASKPRFACWKQTPAEFHSIVFSRGVNVHSVARHTRTPCIRKSQTHKVFIVADWLEKITHQSRTDTQFTSLSLPFTHTTPPPPFIFTSITECDFPRSLLWVLFMCFFNSASLNVFSDHVLSTWRALSLHAPLEIRSRSRPASKIIRL